MLLDSKFSVGTEITLMIDFLRDSFCDLSIIEIQDHRELYLSLLHDLDVGGSPMKKDIIIKHFVLRFREMDFGSFTIDTTRLYQETAVMWLQRVGKLLVVI